MTNNKTDNTGCIRKNRYTRPVRTKLNNTPNNEQSYGKNIIYKKGFKVWPVNPDTSHENSHTLYLGGSGSGKSQAVKANDEIPKKCRLIMWDSSGDHAGIHTENRKKFIELLMKGLEVGHFRLAFAGDSVECFEWFCGIVWAVLDGKYKTFVIAEELSHVCPSTSKATRNAARLLNQGRKYGLIFHGVSQKPQEVSKTFFDQCERKYIGIFKGKNAKIMQDYLASNVKASDIQALEPLNFYYHDGKAASDPEIKTIKYKKVTGVKWV